MSLSSEETAFSFNLHHIQLFKCYSFLAARQKYAIQPVTLPHLEPFKQRGEKKKPRAITLIWNSLHWI